MGYRLLAAFTFIIIFSHMLSGYPTHRLELRDVIHYARHIPISNTTSHNTTVTAVTTPLVVDIAAARIPELHCETSVFSPLREDVEGVKNMLANVHTFCIQTKVTEEGKEGCVKLATFGSSTVGICGSTGTKLPCADVAAVIGEIQRCNVDTHPDRVGGRMEYEWGALIVFGTSNT